MTEMTAAAEPDSETLDRDAEQDARQDDAEQDDAEQDDAEQDAVDTCSICLEAVRGRRRRRLRGCGHCFHASCISQWLRKDDNMACPLCRGVALEGLSDERMRLSARMAKLLAVCAPPAEMRPRYWLPGCVRCLLGSDEVAACLKLDARQRRDVIDLSFLALTQRALEGLLDAWERDERASRVRFAESSGRKSEEVDFTT